MNCGDMWSLRGPQKAFRLLADSVKTVGRATRADIIVDAALVSRVRRRLTATREGVEVEDLESTKCAPLGEIGCRWLTAGTLSGTAGWGIQADVDVSCLFTYYLSMTAIDTRTLDRELKRGSAELLILSLLDARPRHGYDLSKLIHARSGGQLTFHIDSLYPLLYRLEERGWIKGTWVEKPDERRRRFYKVTAEGRRVLAQQKKTWAEFVEAVRRVTGDEHA